MEMLKEAGKMIVEGASGAVLGSTCESFLKSIEKCCTFDYPVLESVKSTVENLKEVLPKMDDHNMKLGDRQDELKELKEEMERGTKLLYKLSFFNNSSWFKASYNDQLVELDASLMSLVRKLRLQSALDVKEVLVLEMENAEVVKSTKRKVDEVDENVKDIQRTQEAILNMMKKQKMHVSASQVEHLLEGAALATKLGELDDVAQEVSLNGRWSPYYRGLVYDYACTTTLRMQRIFGLVEEKTAENEEMTYIPVSVLKNFRISIEEGVDLLRKCPTITEWTEELECEYTIKFRALENTLDGLYNRLAGIRPLKWRCGKCDKSVGAAATSTSLVDPAGFCH